MQHALVRRDAVMLHDPLRTQSRATAVGVIVAAIGMLGFMIFGILKPAAPPPSEGIVISSSGQMYVKVAATETTPEMLIPTFNLASARLILLGQTQAGPPGGPGAPPAEQVEVAQPQVVPDDRLKGIPRGRLQGIVDGPPLLPNEEQRISDNWAVCDNLVLDPSLPDQERIKQAEQQTAVIAGVSELGKPLGANEALLLKQKGDGAVYLVYRPRESANRSANMVRALVDMNNKWVTGPLNITGSEPREASTGLLNAIDEVDEIKAPDIPKKGAATSFDLGGQVSKVGDVFRVQRPGKEEYYVLLEQGKQQVTATVASIIRSALGSQADIPSVVPGLADAVDPVNATEAGYLPVDDYPEAVPEVLTPITRPAVCLGWKLTGEGPGQDARTSVYVGFGLPLPEEDGKPARLARIGKPDESGNILTGFYMPPGHAAAIHSATGKDSFASGNIKLISDQGLAFGIPDVATANGLGLTTLRPAPESIISLLPSGSSLNVQDARRTYDTVPLAEDAGDFNGQQGAATQPGQPSGG